MAERDSTVNSITNIAIVLKKKIFLFITPEKKFGNNHDADSMLQ